MVTLNHGQNGHGGDPATGRARVCPAHDLILGTLGYWPLWHAAGMSPRSSLPDARRIVVKLGTHVVTHDGRELALGRLHAVVEALVQARRAGREVLLVSSGALAMGMRAMKADERPRSLGLRQAYAAIGQGQLMALYARAFDQLGVVAAQVLLTHDDLADRDRALCLRTTLLRLLELAVIPILNENDSVSVRELADHLRHTEGDPGSYSGFGDNDELSARIAVAVDADLLVLLTDVDGLHDAHPDLEPAARRISVLTEIDDELVARAGGASTLGTGGMASKLEAARLAQAAGTAVVIASGHESDILGRILRGEDHGTLVVPSPCWSPRRRYIAVRAAGRGALVVNAGAIDALVRGKASLLPVGVTAVEGEFDRGDIVEIRDGSGRVHGRGLVNYDAAACRALVGRRSSEIDQVLGFRGYDAVITRDNLVLGDV